MNTKESIAWFKKNFGTTLANAVNGTPFSVDMLSAIAYQETGYIWSRLTDTLSLKEIAAICVGDTLDYPNRKAFPRTKAALIAATGGQAMFDIARDCLVQMSKQVPGYSGAVKNKDKFCHGYGIFQYDLQHFQTDPAYFLQKKWTDVNQSIARCIAELKEAKQRQGWAAKTVLTPDEMVYVAIAYNKGSADLKKGFKQGYYDGQKFYGEYIFEYLMLAQSIKTGAGNDNGAPLPDPTPADNGKKVYRVTVKDSALNLRKTPLIPAGNAPSNVLTRLPDGHLVNWLSGKKTDSWLEVETTLNGAYFKGFASAQYLQPVKEVMPEPLEPSVSDPVTGIIAAHLPVKAGEVTRRAEPANARSLNEAGQPVRKPGTLPAELVPSLLKIIDWLDVTEAKHKRYQPVDGKTFCNIYAHDYCRCAGVYFPRVWWTQNAIARLALGEAVAAQYDSTVTEIQANNLFRWLRDFGPRFGWRQTGELTKLQQAANLGGVALIIGRRVADMGSGHVVVIAPEVNVKAKRDAEGKVLLPVQSQAGAVNIKYGTSSAWWTNAGKFAEFAFWIHS